MALDMGTLLAPGTTALVTQECQNGVIGKQAVFPALAEQTQGLIPAIDTLCKAARAAGAPVLHCLAVRRPDGQGANRNARMFGAAAKAPVQLLPGSTAADVADGIEVAESDLVLTRYHGLGPMADTGLAAVLRNLGVQTVVGVGVSLNVGMLNFAMDAVNAGFQFVIPRDGVAGFPPEYAEAVLANTLNAVATITTTDEILAAWR
ncbi:cysteine hydrolase [Yinghuangia aomiensis]|uniref:Cysteine hydrolase n=1 Tax=Yinghuangia aomiensis TaxID=676205 RepID=A0ABP9HWD9_9ACTN